MSIWSSELWCLSHPRIKRTLWKNKSEFVTLVNLNKFVYLRLIWIKPTLSLLGMKILATKAKSASKQLCWWTRWHDPPRASHINGLGFEYLVKLPVKDDFLVLIPEIEPILVYMFILAFDVPGHLPGPGIEPMSPVAPALQADSLSLSHWGSPEHHITKFM